jgi:hypothetical protein
MPQPINYMIDVKDPLEQALRGYQVGSALGQQNLAKQQQEAGRQQAVQMQSDLMALSSKPNATEKDYREFKIKYPSMPDHFNKVLGSMSEEQKQAKQNQAIRVFSALNTGNTDVAERILQEQKEASENSGDTEGARGAEAMLKMLKINPDAAKTSTGLMLSVSMGSEKFSEALENLGTESRAKNMASLKMKQEQQDLKNKGVELNLNNAKINKVIAETKKLDQETKKAVMELEALKATGGIDPDKVFDKEEKIRKEYTARTKNFSAAQDAFSKIEESAKDQSGAGDIALITSFMKMLDPGSVVRETEFATAQDTGGLISKLQNAAEKAKTGKFLTDKQRNEFAGLAKRYMSAATNQEEDVRKSLGKVVKNYSLNPENVFGTMAEEETEEAPVQPAVKSYMKYAGQ